VSRQLLIGGIAVAVAATAIASVAGYQLLDGRDYAEVIAVEPNLRTVRVPREECRDEVRTVKAPTRDPNKITGTVAGAIVGGVLGNQVGSGNGKKLATVAGAVAGGYAGNKVQEGMQERNTHDELQRVCETVEDTHQEQDGYNVTYVIDGQEQMAHMDYDPGSKIPVEDGVIVLGK